MTEAQRRKFHRLCDEMDRQQAQSNLGSYDNMCSWLRRDHYSFYLEVRNNLSELWDEIQEFIGDLFEGLAIGAAAVVALPVIGAVEGIKAIGKWLDDL